MPAGPALPRAAGRCRPSPGGPGRPPGAPARSIAGPVPDWARGRDRSRRGRLLAPPVAARGMSSPPRNPPRRVLPPPFPPPPGNRHLPPPGAAPPARVPRSLVRAHPRGEGVVHRRGHPWARGREGPAREGGALWGRARAPEALPDPPPCPHGRRPREEGAHRAGERLRNGAGSPKGAPGPGGCSGARGADGPNRWDRSPGALYLASDAKRGDPLFGSSRYRGRRIARVPRAPPTRTGRGSR